MIQRLDIKELVKVLHELDYELGDEKIEIRAVGGFAFAWLKVREEGLTADIDTLTCNYPESVCGAIARVGMKYGLDQWWLNNDRLQKIQFLFCCFFFFTFLRLLHVLEGLL